MDFVSDKLADGRPFRAFTMLDDFTRNSPLIEVAFHLPRERIIAVSDRLAEQRRLSTLLG